MATIEYDLKTVFIKNNLTWTLNLLITLFSSHNDSYFNFILHFNVYNQNICSCILPLCTYVWWSIIYILPLCTCMITYSILLCSLYMYDYLFHILCSFRWLGVYFWWPYKVWTRRIFNLVWYSLHGTTLCSVST